MRSRALPVVMRSRALPFVGVSLAALAVATAFAPNANAGGAAPQPTIKTLSNTHSQAHGAATCVSQRDNDNGKAVVSQRFERSYVAFTSWAADDFTLTQACGVTHVAVDGRYLGGSGKAKSFNVVFYRNAKKDVPGTIIAARRQSAYTVSHERFRIFWKSSVPLNEGTYWVSVQANLDYLNGGLWGWLTNNTVRGAGSVWANPGDGFAYGCTRWTRTTTCIDADEGGDYSFSLG